MRNVRAPLVMIVVIFALVASACGVDDPLANPREPTFPEGLFDPTETDLAQPDGYRESLPRDAILPIYDPTFIAASEVEWDDGDLVIGVDLGGEARAYPVGLLTFREIVIDDHGGIPTMVSW